MSVREQRASEALERTVLDALPIDVEHVPDDEAREFDARLLEDPAVPEHLTPAPASGDETELKTCQFWIDD